MLSLTSAKSGALIGVLISVTTIPAAANIGGRGGLRGLGEAGGAAAQLGINLAAIVLAGVLTLFVQRRFYVRDAASTCGPGARSRPACHRPERPQAARASATWTPSEDQMSIFVRTRAMTSSVNSVVVACPPRSGVRTPGGGGLEHRLVDRPRGELGAPRGRARPVVEQGGAGQDHRHRVRDVLALERRRRAVRRLGHDRAAARSPRRTPAAPTRRRRSSRTAAARSRTGSRRRG